MSDFMVGFTIGFCTGLLVLLGAIAGIRAAFLRHLEREDKHANRS